MVFGAFTQIIENKAFLVYYLRWIFMSIRLGEIMDIIKNNWNSILQKLKEDHEIKDIPFDTWIKPLEPYKLENKTLYIIYNMEEAQNETISYIKKKYEMPLMVAISEFTNEKYEIIFLLKKDANKTSSVNKEETKKDTSYKTDNNFSLNPKYTFETFVVGPSNNFAYTACLAVAESVGEVYNPLYINGGPGLGKTHLMHAICQYILDEDSSKKILYVTSEEFTNDVINSLHNNKGGNNSDRMAKLRDKYRSVDVLIVEDIQFLGMKCKTSDAANIAHKSWIQLKAKVKYEFAKEYKGKGPVLYPLSIEPGTEPEDSLVYFN